MEQFIWLIVLIVIWIVPSIIKANKKKKAAEMQAAQRRQSQAQGQTKPTVQQQKQASNSDEVEKMLEKLLGVEITQEKEQETYEESYDEDDVEYERIDFESEDSLFNAPSDSNYDLDRAEKLSFEELIAMGEADAGLLVENISDSENSVHPEISDFDLRKAVIYSEILTPKHF
mgnify:CR=1 FL=1